MKASVEDWEKFKGSAIQQDLLEHLSIILQDIGNEICKTGDDMKMPATEAYRMITHLMGSRQAVEKLIMVIKEPLDIAEQLMDKEEDYNGEE